MKNSEVTAAKFTVVFLEDAAKFLDGLSEKVRDKIIYNITKAKFSNDKNLFKKLRIEIWEFRTCLTRPITDYLPFGIKQRKQIRL